MVKLLKSEKLVFLNVKIVVAKNIIHAATNEYGYSLPFSVNAIDSRRQQNVVI